MAAGLAPGATIQGPEPSTYQGPDHCTQTTPTPFCHTPLRLFFLCWISGATASYVIVLIGPCHAVIYLQSLLPGMKQENTSIQKFWFWMQNTHTYVFIWFIFVVCVWTVSAKCAWLLREYFLQGKVTSQWKADFFSILYIMNAIVQSIDVTFVVSQMDWNFLICILPLQLHLSKRPSQNSSLLLVKYRLSN